MSELVQRLSQGTHRITCRPRRDDARTELRTGLQREYVHVLLTGAAGDIELGFPPDRATSDLSRANWEAGEGSIHVEGDLGLNGTPVRCVADLDLRTMEGTGRLNVVPSTMADVRAGAMQARPERDLTSADGLADALGLNRGDVLSVRVTSTASSGHSWLTFFHVTYGGAVAASLPRRLLLKHKPLPRIGKAARMREADFYSRLAPALPSPPVVRCFAARGALPTSPGHVLIEDLRATHMEPPLDEEACFGPAVDALACLHAARWEGHDAWPEASPNEESIRADLRRMAAHLPTFFDAAGDALRPDERRLYERVFSSALRPWLRPLDGRGVTLTHGSAHIGNFLFPREPGGDAYLVDWERWRVDIGARDLAYMMMQRRLPDGRRQLEETLLRRYLAQLEALGVRGYGWDDLWTDYRRCWVRNLTATIRKYHRADESWRVLLDRAVAAFVDLDCEELL